MPIAPVPPRRSAIFRRKRETINRLLIDVGSFGMVSREGAGTALSVPLTNYRKNRGPVPGVSPPPGCGSGTPDQHSDPGTGTEQELTEVAPLDRGSRDLEVTPNSVDESATAESGRRVGVEQGIDEVRSPPGRTAELQQWLERAAPRQFVGELRLLAIAHETSLLVRQEVEECVFERTDVVGGNRDPPPAASIMSESASPEVLTTGSPAQK